MKKGGQMISNIYHGILCSLNTSNSPEINKCIGQKIYFLKDQFKEIVKI